jgi:hypothetical protein
VCTSLALVGAYILAGELAAASADVAAATEQEAVRGAFDRYEIRMRPYVKQSQKLPPGGVDGYAPDEQAPHRPRPGLDALVAALADATHDGARLQQG